MNTDPAAVKARWVGPPSRFVKLNGVLIHRREEGPRHAPVVVLLHGSIVNLHECDLVAPHLAKTYRVARFDGPPYGLSGPDPRGSILLRAPPN